MVVTGTLLGLMGTDLVLPAVPMLPEQLGGDASTAQLVLAAYVGGTCLGLLAFGALADRLSTRSLFIGSLAGTALLSLACAMAPDTGSLVILRAIQGAIAAAPAVFAPRIIRALFDEERAIRAIGVLGSIESMAPALAPILGVWLLSLGGWRMSFYVLAGFAILLTILMLVCGVVPQTARRPGGSYRRLLGDLVFLRYAISQALVLGGLLTFVFGMPAIFVRVLGGSLTDFIVMQVAGIAAFVTAANLTGKAVARFGAERVIGFGTGVSCAGAGVTLVYALVGGSEPVMITGCFVLVGIGLGLRGPPGFFRAVLASRGDDARGSALVILGILGAAALGTSLAAPFIEEGLVPLTAVVFAMEAGAVLALLLPRLGD